MNFFLPSGNLDVAGAKPEPPRVEVTETKSIHSSEDELEWRETNLGGLSSLPRRQKTRGLANRKHNKEFRSVWYDDDAEKDTENVTPAPRLLKKSTSLDNLLEIEGNRFKARALVTKNMISSPVRLRKIVGDWTSGREIERDSVSKIDIEENVKRKMSDPVETASVAVEFFSKFSDGDVAVAKSERSASLTDTKCVLVEEENEAEEVQIRKNSVRAQRVRCFSQNEERPTVQNERVKSQPVAELKKDLQPSLSTLGTKASTLPNLSTIAIRINADKPVTQQNLLTFESKANKEVSLSSFGTRSSVKNEVCQPSLSTLENRKSREIPNLSTFGTRTSMEKEVPQQNLTTFGNRMSREMEISQPKRKSTEIEAAIPNLSTFGTRISVEKEVPQPNLTTFGTKIVDKVDDTIQTITVAQTDEVTSASREAPVEKEVEKELVQPETQCRAVEKDAMTESNSTATRMTEPEEAVDEVEPEVLLRSSFKASKNPTTEPDETIELQTLNTTFGALKVVETVVFDGRDMHYRKNATLEGRGKYKKVGKIEISHPIAPKMMLQSGKEVDMAQLDTEGVTNLLRMKSRSTNDLLKSFSNIKNDKSEQLNNPKFPIPETEESNDDVQIRRCQQINQYRCSKTTDFDFGRKWTDNAKDFEVKGLTKMLISSNTSPVDIKRSDTLKYQNGNFYKIDSISRKTLKTNVTLRSARMVGKRDVELRDSNNIAYILYFDSSKDAKVFLESDKIRCYTENDNKSTITKTLLRLLGKRSSRELLEKKGIYQNEPIFGNTLRNIYSIERGVPQFILRTMELIERPENITSLGIYRTSGNLATIQKIRFEVDKGRLGILNEYCKDVDVLTGCLKLFFRELKEPLIPCEVCDSLLSVTKGDKKYSKSERHHIRQIITKLPEANYETLYVLIRHLIKVVRYKEENKMDTYNLSVCWGPTIIFMTDPTPMALTKDPMAQTADAARLFDYLLTYYTEHPEELDFSRKIQEHLDSNKNPIQRQDSKESVRSIDSNTSRSQKRSGSNLSLNVDEVLKKAVELIEANLDSEGLYKKSGSTEKINKIVKKMLKRKVSDLDRHKNDINELTDSLKKYLREMPEPLVTQECVEQVRKYCDACPCLETHNRQRIISAVDSLPKRDNLLYLVRHIIKVTKHEVQHNVSRTDIISIWTNVLNYQTRVVESNDKFSKFLAALLDVFDDSKADAVPSPKSFANGLLNDLKNYQKDKDRVSKYDNVPDTEGNVQREATILEEKTEEVAEHTKL